MYGSSTSKLLLNASVRDKEAVSHAWPSYRDKTYPQRWKESALCSNSAAASTQYVDKFGILKDKDLLVQPQPRKIAKISRKALTAFAPSGDISVATRVLVEVDPGLEMQVSRRGPTNLQPEQQQRSKDYKFDVSDEQRTLNKDINACIHPESLLALVSKSCCSPDFNTVNAATAFYKLAKLLERFPEAGKAQWRADARTVELARIVESRWQEWGGFATSNIVWAHSSLHHGSPDLPFKAEARVLQTLHKMRPIEVSGALPGLLALGQMSRATFVSIRPVLLHWIKLQYGVLPLRSISALARVYAKSESLTSDADQEIYEALATATKIALKAADSKPRELANLVWGFAKLEIKDGPLFDLLAAKIFSALDPKRQDIPGFHLASQDLAQMAWGLGKGFSSNVVVPQRYARPDSWLNDYINQYPIRTAVFERILRRAHQISDKFVDMGIAGLLSGCAYILFYNQKSLTRMSEVVRKQCSSYSTQAVSVTIWALATLHFDAPETFEALADRMLYHIQHNPETLNDQAVAMFLTSCGVMHTTHLPKCMQACRELAILVEGDVQNYSNAQSLANTAYALTVLDILEPSFFRKICLAMSKTKGPFQQELPQIYQADLALKLKSPNSIASTTNSAVDISEFLQECFDLGQLKMASKAHWQNLLKNSFRNISGLQWAVAQTLKSLGAHFRLEYDDEDYPVDIALEGQKIAIEVDGPHHFTANTRRPLGYHVLKTRLLQLQGWKIISVPFYEWEGLHVRSKQRAYLAKLLWDAGWHGPAESPDATAHLNGSRNESSQPLKDVSHARMDTHSVEENSEDSWIQTHTGVEKAHAPAAEELVEPVLLDADTSEPSQEESSSNGAELPNSVDSVRQAAMLSLLEKRGGKPRSKLERLSRLSNLQNRTQW